MPADRKYPGESNASFARRQNNKKRKSAKGRKNPFSGIKY